MEEALKWVRVGDLVFDDTIPHAAYRETFGKGGRSSCRAANWIRLNWSFAHPDWNQDDRSCNK